MSFSKAIEQRAWVCKTGATSGPVRVTLVLAVAIWPLSSDTLQVIPTGPVGAPVEEKTAEGPLPLMAPAAAE